MKSYSPIVDDHDVVTKKYVDDVGIEVTEIATKMVISPQQISSTQPSNQDVNDVWLEVLT